MRGPERPSSFERRDEWHEPVVSERRIDSRGIPSCFRRITLDDLSSAPNAVFMDDVHRSLSRVIVSGWEKTKTVSIAERDVAVNASAGKHRALPSPFSHARVDTHVFSQPINYLGGNLMLSVSREVLLATAVGLLAIGGAAIHFLLLDNDNPWSADTGLSMPERQSAPTAHSARTPASSPR